MAKLPRLDEVFLSCPKPINVGSAYSIKEEFPPKKNEAGPVSGGKLRPEQEKLVKQFAHDILRDLEGDPVHGTHDADLEDRLRKLIIASEKAEGEDPGHE